MKAKWIAGLILTVFLGCGIAHAQESADIVTKTVAIKRATLRPKKPFIIRAAIAGASCGIAIGFAGNPATAAGIGLPIFIGGNALAYKLYENHPRWSAFVQTLSPLGCYLGGRIGTHPKPQVKTSGPGNSGGTNGGSTTSPGSGSSGSGSGTGSGGTNSSGSGGSGSNGGVGSGTGSSSGSGSGASTGSGSGSGAGTGSGSTGAGSGSGSGSGSGGGPGSGSGGGGKVGCIKDCGFPGNGGTNGGNDPKPPFPGQGNGGSNAGNGK